jgi:hypothetical protein
MRKTEYVLPVVSAVMAGMILQALGEKAIHAVYPPPPGLNFTDKAAIAAYAAQIPTVVFVLILVNYVVCALLSGVIATQVSGRKSVMPALITGAIITLGGIFNVVMIPHPMWFVVISVLLYIPSVWLGYQLSLRLAKVS